LYKLSLAQTKRKDPCNLIAKDCSSQLQRCGVVFGKITAWAESPNKNTRWPGTGSGDQIASRQLRLFRERDFRPGENLQTAVLSASHQTLPPRHCHATRLFGGYTSRDELLRDA
jgi:hypothetical protein